VTSKETAEVKGNPCIRAVVVYLLLAHGKMDDNMLQLEKQRPVFLGDSNPLLIEKALPGLELFRKLIQKLL
jgi:hypothetical protein